MQTMIDVAPSTQRRILAISTLAFTTCFAVWTLFSIIGIQIKQDLGLNETQYGLLIATPILSGSLSRVFLGIWADQYGGRVVNFILMVTTAIVVALLSLVQSYIMFLLAALGLGIAGGSFAVGITYVSSWYQNEKQGTALGIFGMGNVGAAITNFGAPFLMVAFGWEKVAQIYAVGLVIIAVIFWFCTDTDPATKSRRIKGEPVRSILSQMLPLKNIKVWRFSVYYFFVFGGFVALALWLPRFYMGAYGLDIETAGMLAAAFALPGGIFRVVGGWLSDRIGARRVMYWTFSVCMVCTFLLAYPSTHFTIQGIEGPIILTATIGLLPFVLLTVVLGFFMSLGKAAVYKFIPVHYPKHVGSVGGMVGMVGGLGGFILPICFGMMNDLTGIWTSCFILLFVIVCLSMIWLISAIKALERQIYPDLDQLIDFPELTPIFLGKKKTVHAGLGDFLIRQGEKADCVYLLTEGEVAIIKDGVEISRQKPGAIIGEMGVITNQPRNASVKCLTQIKALQITAYDFLKAVKENPTFMHTINRTLISRLDFADQKISGHKESVAN